MKELTDEQIDIVFMYYLLKPEDEDIKELYKTNKKAEKTVQELPVDVLKASGYSDEAIEAMRVDIEKGVMNG